MTKKEFLLTILSKLVGKRNLAESIMVLIDDGVISDKTIDAIADIVEKAYRESKLSFSADTMDKMQKSLKSLKTSEQQINREDCDKLDDLLANI